MTEYTTKMGDAWDLIAYDHYGTARYLEALPKLMQANPDYTDVLVFMDGVKLSIPDLPDVLPENRPFWRLDDE